MVDGTHFPHPLPCLRPFLRRYHIRSPEPDPLRIRVFFSSEWRSVTNSSPEMLPNEGRFGISSCWESDAVSTVDKEGPISGRDFRSGKALNRMEAMRVDESELLEVAR